MITLRPEVKIVPLEMKHAERMFKWMENPFIRENIGLQTEPSLEKTKAWILKAQEDSSIHAFAVEFDGEHVGNSALDHHNTYLKTAQLSAYIGENLARGGGTGRTVERLTCQYGFETLGLHKVWARIHIRHHRALSTALQVGFKLEGVLRGEYILGDERIDAYYIGMLKSDFDNVPTTMS